MLADKLRVVFRNQFGWALIPVSGCGNEKFWPIVSLEFCCYCDFTWELTLDYDRKILFVLHSTDKNVLKRLELFMFTMVEQPITTFYITILRSITFAFSMFVQLCTSCHSSKIIIKIFSKLVCSAVILYFHEHPHQLFLSFKLFEFKTALFQNATHMY